MAEEVEGLVLAHFREIVEKGKAAIENVESAGDQAPAPMLKAAQNLVKEGERALKKIEPISTANYEEYGSNFINAIKENGAILLHSFTHFASWVCILMCNCRRHIAVSLGAGDVVMGFR